MIKVAVEVREGTVPFRVAVEAGSISQAVSFIERRHPGRDVRVVFPIDPDEFFTGGREAAGTGRDESDRSRPVHEPVMRV